MTVRRIALLADAGSVHTVRWARGLADRGHDVHVVSLHEPSPDLTGVPVHRLSASAPLGYFLGAHAVRQRLRALGSVILHAHYATGYGTLGRLAGHHPFVLSVWGSDVLSFPDRSPVHRALVAANLGAADVVTATSRALAERVRHIRPRPDDVPVIPFGVDTVRFAPSPRNATPDRVTIGTVKALHAKYGIDRLLEAAARAAERLAESGGPALRVRILGEGPARPALEAQVRASGLRDVEMPGAVPFSQVPRELAQLDVFVALSRVEGFGVAVLEAAACGVPAVVSDAGGLPEIVDEGRTGYVIPGGEPGAAAPALVRLAQDGDLRRRLGEAACARARAEFAWDACLDRMEEVYARVAGGAP